MDVFVVICDIYVSHRGTSSNRLCSVVPKPTFTPSLTPSLALFLFQEWTPDKKHKRERRRWSRKQ